MYRVSHGGMDTKFIVTEAALYEMAEEEGEDVENMLDVETVIKALTENHCWEITKLADGGN